MATNNKEIDISTRTKMNIMDVDWINFFSKEFSIITDYNPYRDYIDFEIPYLSNQNRIIYIEKGAAKLRINTEDVFLSQNHIITLPKKTTITNLYWSKDFNPYTVVFDSDAPVLMGLMMYNTHVIKLEHIEATTIRNFINLISDITHLPNYKDLDMMTFVKPLLLLISKSQNNKTKPVLTRNEKIRNQFLIDLQCNFNPEAHNIAYYANLQHITPNTLSSAVSKAGGHTARQLLNLKFLSEIDTMILYESATAEDIINRLYFKSHSQFAHFFKKNTNTTFSDYCKEKKKGKRISLDNLQENCTQ